MVRTLLLALWLTAAPIAAMAQPADQRLAGDWDGVIGSGGTARRLTLHFTDKLTFDSPDQGAFGLPAAWKRDGDQLTVTSPAGLTFSGRLSSDGQVFASTLTQGPLSVPIEFRHRAPGQAAPGPIATILAPGEREVSIDGGSAPLYGTLRAAADGKPGPAVLILAGSGPTNRDGDSTIPGNTPASLKMIAEALAAHGYASLRIDKRAIGKSSAAARSEAALRFTDYVEDAAAWTRFLRAQPGVTCVVILGHSEGALVAALAAQKAPVCGVVEVAGEGRTMGVVLREQARTQQLPPEQLRRWDDIIGHLERGQLMPEVPATDLVFHPSVQPYLISEISIDPTAALKAVKAPVLIVQGDNDRQISLADARLLAAARPDARLVIIHGMTHVLKHASADPADQRATYADPTRPLAPGLMEAIMQFLAGVKP